MISLLKSEMWENLEKCTNAAHRGNTTLLRMGSDENLTIEKVIKRFLFKDFNF